MGWHVSCREKEEEPIIQLSFTKSPEELQKDSLGLGIINHDSEEPTLFLIWSRIKYENRIWFFQMETLPDAFISWEPTIDDEKIVLEIGEEKILAV